MLTKGGLALRGGRGQAVKKAGMLVWRNVTKLHQQLSDFTHMIVYILRFVHCNAMFLQRGIGISMLGRMPSLGVSSLDLGRSGISDGPLF
jgi:hypothetical protein